MEQRITNSSDLKKYSEEVSNKLSELNQKIENIKKILK